MKGRRRRRSKQLVDELKESQDRTGHWELKEGAADRSVWRTCLVQRLWSCGRAEQRVKGCSGKKLKRVELRVLKIVGHMRERVTVGW